MKSEALHTCQERPSCHVDFSHGLPSEGGRVELGHDTGIREHSSFFRRDEHGFPSNCSLLLKSFSCTILQLQGFILLVEQCPVRESCFCVCACACEQNAVLKYQVGDNFMCYALTCPPQRGQRRKCCLLLRCLGASSSGRVSLSGN